MALLAGTNSRWVSSVAMRTDAVPAISIEAVTCRFGDVRALDALSFEAAPSMVTGIVGPNGAGKTTLMDVLSGITRPTSGRVSVLGHDVLSDPALVRARIGVVTQETALYEELSPIQNLQFSAALYGVVDPGRRIASVLDLVGLSARARDRVSTLSGGMQRRLAIARALLHEPELLLFDEPTLGVDVEARHQIWNHVRRLRDEGRSILLATNYLDEAEALCDSVAVIRSGKIVAQDTPAALIARAGRCLDLECKSADDGALVKRALSSHPRAKRAEAAGDRVTVYFEAGTDPDELVRAAMDVTHLEGFRTRPPDLMEVLRAISGGDA
jgi:ABC-type multidrug transport system ATPase subunit